MRDNIGWRTLSEPDTGTGFGKVFTVGDKSVVCRVFPTTGETAEDDDLFELHHALDWNRTTGVPSRTLQLKEKDPVGGTSYTLTLGANMTQAEIVIRGDYVWKKLTATTPLVGVQGSRGYEKL